jgi:Trypsin-like peptidase domain
MRMYDPPLSPEQVAAKALPSVVVVTAGDSYGSGVAVGPHQVLTALHVVAGSPEIWVRSRGGIEHRVASVLAFDKDADVVLLETAGESIPALELFTKDLPEPGQAITVIGAPEQLEFSVSTGVLSAVRQLDQVQVLQTTAAISHGSSGGPVLDSRGRVIGIVGFFLRNGQELNFATAATSIGTVLREARPTNLPAFATLTAPAPQRQTTAPESTGPAASAATTADPRSFPKSVAGFPFLSTFDDLKAICTSAPQQQLRRAGRAWNTQLTVNGAWATCPGQAEQVDFVQPNVSLKLVGGHLAEVSLEPNSYIEAVDRLRRKYGAPDLFSRSDKGPWHAWSAKAPSAGVLLIWQLKGGFIVLLPAAMNSKRGAILFSSGDARRYENEGF